MDSYFLIVYATCLAVYIVVSGWIKISDIAYCAKTNTPNSFCLLNKFVDDIDKEFMDSIVISSISIQICPT